MDENLNIYSEVFIVEEDTRTSDSYERINLQKNY